MLSTGKAFRGSLLEAFSAIRRRVASRGQGMVEFALVIPLVLMLMWGIIEGGRLLYIYSSLSAAGREAARYGAGVGKNGSGTILYYDCAGIRAAAKRIGFYLGLPNSSIHIFHDSGTPVDQTEYCNYPNYDVSTDNSVAFKAGDRISVLVTIPYSPVVPMPFLPSVQLQSESSHSIVMEVPVLAYTPISIPGGQNCDISQFNFSESPSPYAQVVTVTITNNGPSVGVSGIVVVWTNTGQNYLESVLPVPPAGAPNYPGIHALSPSMWTQSITGWTLAAGSATTPSSTSFNVSFTKAQAQNTNIIVQLSLSNGCSIGH